MSARLHNVLVLCTGNSCRSVMAEALLNALGHGRVRAYSAGSRPLGRINDDALATLARHGLPTEGYRSQSWEEFRDTPIDILISVCDAAGGEACPAYLGTAVRGHWGVADPGHVEGTPEARIAAFDATFATLQRRVEAMLHLPLAELGREALGAELNRIGRDIR